MLAGGGVEMEGTAVGSEKVCVAVAIWLRPDLICIWGC